ncbi:MAG: HK97 family phage prohead protease [Blastomonas sp.]
MPRPAIRLAGYAALFDRLDRSGDIIRHGAFERTLAGGVALPLLWQHRPGEAIGRIVHASEDRRGLRVIAELAANAGEAMDRLRDGSVTGLSFGYRVHRRRGTRPRELLDVDLVEVSLVTVPMMPGARVHMLV